MHHITKPDSATLHQYARGALVCERIFEQAAQVAHVMPEAEAPPSVHVATPAPNEWQAANAAVNVIAGPVHTIVDDGKVVSPQGNANGATLGAPIPDQGPY